MSEHGAALQTCNQELVKCLEELKSKRNVVEAVIRKEESQKATLEKNLRILQEKLHTLNKSLDHHKGLLQVYDNTIKETESGFRKILESTEALLHVAQLEANKLDSSLETTISVCSQQDPGSY